MRLYVDMDGVLADFDAHHLAVFGRRSDKVADNVDWGAVRAVRGFYESIPPMPDLPELWSAIAPMRPTVLTGVPSSVPQAPENKLRWVRRHLGDDVRVICCLSKDKALHCHPGDILIDDWPKYRDRWLAAGGVWITHRSARETISELMALGVGYV